VRSRIAASLYFAFALEAQQSNQASSIGNCSPAIVGNTNKVTVTCTDKKALTEVLVILNKIANNQLPTAEVLSKLDEIIAAQTQQKEDIQSIRSTIESRSEHLAPPADVYLRTNLTPFRARHLQIRYLGDPDTSQLGSNLEVLFKSFGFNVSVIPIGMSHGLNWRGINILRNADYEGQFADKIFQCFTHLGLNPELSEATNVGPEEGVVIQIGPR